MAYNNVPQHLDFWLGSATRTDAGPSANILPESVISPRISHIHGGDWYYVADRQ